MNNNHRPSSSVINLKNALKKQKPQHDTPIGLIHPYWARKPLNIIDTIINELSRKGDVVFDPFVGSGTIAFSALANERKALASDLNPLSVFITRNILDLPLFTDGDLKYIRDFFVNAANKYSAWYITPTGQMIERVRYKVVGQYKNGRFSLHPLELITKAKVKSGWRGRNSNKVSKWNFPKPMKSFLSAPINFKKITLPENSRIAIPQGALLSHFFDDFNKATINLISNEISNLIAKENIKRALLFILSSSIPLLRLSDKKATSQWPYWRPKNIVTSRNPYFILEKRVEAFCDAVDWARIKIKNIIELPLTDFQEKKRKNSFCIFQTAAQNIRKKGIIDRSVDLLLTDPPYADQAPYLEYSELWNGLLFKRNSLELYSDEIVKTDAPTRKMDSRSYIKRLCLAFGECCRVIKPSGYFAFFYQDRNLLHWNEIYKTLGKHGMSVIDTLALPKQRRSLKTVTSPGRTLDGDLLVIAQKINLGVKIKQKEKLEKLSIPKSPKTFFERYAYLIKEGLVNGNMELLAEENEDVFSLLRK